MASVTGGFPQQNRAQTIVGVVSEHALHAAAGLMLKAFFFHNPRMAGGAELLDGEVPPMATRPSS